jgi:cystathionine beta-lyase family protein involved in aluminum resistance
LIFLGLFKKVEEKDDSLKKIKREFDEQANDTKEAVEFILKNFNQFRVSDGLLDGKSGYHDD